MTASKVKSRSWELVTISWTSLWPSPENIAISVIKHEIIHRTSYMLMLLYTEPNKDNPTSEYGTLSHA